MKNICFILFFLVAIVAKAQYNIDRINAPINPLPLAYTRAHYGLKGDVKQAFTLRFMDNHQYLTFDASGNLITQLNQKYFYDTNGNLIKTVYESSNPITYTITTDTKKRITKITDGKDHQRTYSYNIKGLLADEGYGDDQKKIFTYDLKGRLISDNSTYQEYIYTYTYVNEILQVDRKTIYKSNSQPTFTTRYFNTKGDEIYGLTGEFLNTYDEKGNCLAGVYYGVTNNTSYSYFSNGKKGVEADAKPTTADTFGATSVSGDCKNGWGKTTYTDGSFYEGFWQGGFRNGYGTFTSKKFLYAGEWKNHNTNGVGYAKTETQNMFGHFENSLLNGNAYRVSKDKTEIGYFEKDLCRYPITYKKNEITTGCIMGDCKTNFGRYLYPNGELFEGFFKDGKRLLGDLKSVGKYVYQGQFSDDQFNGFGRYQGVDGIQYSGNWKNGKYDGLGFYSEANRKNIKKGQWANGVLIKSM